MKANCVLMSVSDPLVTEFGDAYKKIKVDNHYVFECIVLESNFSKLDDFIPGDVILLDVLIRIVKDKNVILVQTLERV